MKRLVIISLLLLGLALIVGSTAALAQSTGAKHSEQVEAKAPPAGHTECQTECKSCAAECEKTLAYCLKQGGLHKDGKHIQALKDCIASCKISHDFMSRGSDLSSQTCALCAQACKRCAESCATFNDKAMQECAQECKKCEKSCTDMDTAN
jgi:hypothetical protein